MIGWLTALVTLASASGPFTYQPVGQLQADATGYVSDGALIPGMQFPLETAPAYANSQVYGHGGYHGPGGGQCDTENYSYPWWDNYCEPRSWSMPLCPSGTGHQGQDIRPSTCDNDTHWAVAAEAGTITNIGSYSVYLTTPAGVRHRYLHMKPSSLQVSYGDWVNKGDRLGRVSNTFFDSSGNPVPTTIHLHYDIRMNVQSVGGNAYVSPYLSLVESYEALLGAEAEPCSVVPSEGGDLDDSGPCFSRWGSADYWRSVSGAGEGGGFIWTNGWESDTPGNWARWHLFLESGGKYAVQVSVVSPYNASTSVPYTIRHQGGEDTVVLDQSAGEGWRSLGVFDFAAGGDQHISVFDNTGETAADRHITVDAVRLIPSGSSGSGPEPEPDPPQPAPIEPEPEPEPSAAGENLNLPPEVWTDQGWKDTEGEYLPGVVQGESGWMPTSWFATGTPARRHQALQAQAIAARTYLLRHLNAEGMSAMVPIGPHFQTWAPEAASHDHAAVQDTAGAVMTWQGWVITGNYASGAWPLDASGWPHKPVSYGLDQHGQQPTLEWSDIAALYAAGDLHDLGDGYSWTWTLLTLNDGKSGSAVVPTPQSSPGPRNRGSMGQYRSLWLAHTEGFTTSELLRYWYGADLTIAHYEADEEGNAPPAPPRDGAAPPNAPTGLTPDGLPPQTPPSVSLAWGDVAGAEGYEVEVQYLDAQQSWAWVLTESVEQGTGLTLWPHMDDTYYRWRVRAASTSGWGDWSQWAVFGYGSQTSDIPDTPDTPTNTTPTGLTATPEGGNGVSLNWQMVPDASNYDIEVQLNAQGGYLPYATWSPFAPPLSIWPATSPGSYRVRVRAKGGWGVSDWSDWVSFDFEAVQIVITLPPGGEQPVPGDLWPASTLISEESVTLSWSALENTANYEIDIDWLNGSLWNSYTTFETSATAKTFWPQVDPATYRWRVRRSGGTWSDWATFDYDTEASASGASSPVDLWPSGGVEVQSESVSLSWAPVAGAAGYSVSIEWLNGGTWTSYYTYETSDTTKTFWPQVDAATYRWRVRASLNGTWSNWSTWAEFYFDD
ncbi:MAG: peptidoglycan DD-metalloendopeptidase family protein [Myxococcota bacterium]